MLTSQLPPPPLLPCCCLFPFQLQQNQVVLLYQKYKVSLGPLFCLTCSWNGRRLKTGELSLVRHVVGCNGSCCLIPSIVYCIYVYFITLVYSLSSITELHYGILGWEFQEISHPGIDHLYSPMCQFSFRMVAGCFPWLYRTRRVTERWEFKLLNKLIG